MDMQVLKQAAMLNPSEVLHPYDNIISLDGGFEAICAFSENMGGFTVYVSSVRTIFSRCLEAAARDEFTGSNYASLARRYGFTERHMRRMMGRL